MSMGRKAAVSGIFLISVGLVFRRNLMSSGSLLRVPTVHSERLWYD